MYISVYMPKRIRVNISVDKELLDKAKTKLDLFGGKLSTLFNVYLRDFTNSIDKNFSDDKKAIDERLKDIEIRLKKLEKR